ncbi:L,D-transpeptidase family protein [Paenibacillus alba]|uniref:L,D-transpeptidase n=1 Tax=Paenibacillus alba TaxID=1197127 RepID=A0ABU6G487_9BACL|nr:L,D-transpeptidase [Paenibacillus alba]MEC0228982.1 L,D-transpeptidase [Paenibacillus alba]
MKENNRNDQLERFFQHNPIEDPLYLKKYVKEHPDHKMAWYLLGREYAAQGKEGKAAYCFAQAGEIYEAFERQKISIEGPLPSYPSPASQKEAEASSVKRKASGKGKWLPVLVLLLLLAVPAGMDLAKGDGKDISAGPSKTGDAAPAKTSNSGSVPVEAVSSDGVKLYLSEGDWGRKLQQVLGLAGTGTGESVIMEAPSSADGKWREWNRFVKPLIGVESQAEGGRSAELKYYQSQICSCQVADSTALTPVITSWMRDREQAIVLQSAVQAYQKKTGAMPEKPEQLTKPYPANLLPGLTPEMQEIFPQVVSRLNESAKAGKPLDEKPSSDTKDTPQQTTKEPTSSTNIQPKSSADPLREPLSILIDTDKHQLALVSGNIIIRKYPVGLGAEKTPQGEFVISEKVRNPNGRSNGEFGSRGMTLSDTLYAIHGTNKPSSIGGDESHGCVRMLQADVEELYNMVSHETKVTIGKGILPPESEGSSSPGGGGAGTGAGRGKPDQSFTLPLQTKDDNPGKKYKWLD